MTLQEIRELLMKEAGWYDKVNADLSDNGANFFINSGIQYLELQLGWNKSDSLLEKELSAGDTLIEFTNPRYVVEVYYLSEDDNEPIYVEWASVPETPDGDESSWPLKVIQVEADDDNDRTMYIRAVWHTDELSDDDAYNFWTLQYPSLVAQAAQMQREIFYRNATGVADFEGQILRTCTKIYHDLVQEECAGDSDDWIRRG